MPTKKPKKSAAIANLPKKSVSSKKAESVKGGKRKDDRISANHNQTLRFPAARQG